MLSQSKLLGLLIISCLTLNLPTHTHGQFWKTLQSTHQSWERETLASRAPGICYGTQIVDTLNADLRNRQVSFCCVGYVNRGSPSNLKCEPICEEDCSNGICVSPGSCECAPEYNRKNSKCVPYWELN